MSVGVILGVLLLTSTLAHADNDVIVHNQRLFVNGQEYFIRGMCYNPSPIGYSNSTGLCSPRFTPWNEWKSACYDSDFADGSVWPPPTGPAGTGGWFSKLWARDVPAMAAAGVNTIRLYSANAVTQAASVTYNGTRSIVISGAGKEHRKFLDYCWSYGIRVIFPLLSDCNMYLTLDNDTIEWMLRNQIDEVGDHPALLMYAIGNEWSLKCSSQWQLVTRKMGTAVRYARQYQYARWKRYIPQSTASLNNANQFNYILANMPVDVFGVNSYEGARGTFTMPGLYANYKPLMCQYGAALFIAEYNPQSWSNADREYATGVPTYWRDFTANADEYGIIGAAYFEWTNEPSKGSSQNDLGVVRLQTAIDPTSGRSSVSLNGWDVTDNAIAKTITLNSICCGTINNVAYNYKADTWALIGRAPYTLTNVPAICAADAPGYPAEVTSLVATTSASASTSRASTSTTAATTTAATTTAASSTTAATSTIAASTASASISAMDASAASTLVSTTSTASTSVSATTSALVAATRAMSLAGATQSATEIASLSSTSTTSASVSATTSASASTTTSASASTTTARATTSSSASTTATASLSATATASLGATASSGTTHTESKPTGTQEPTKEAESGTSVHVDQATGSSATLPIAATSLSLLWLCVALWV